MIKQYRKKPVVISALQHHGTQETGDEIIEWTKGSKTPAYWTTEVRNCSERHPDGFDYPVLRIKTLEGDHTVSPMDQVIEGVAGEFYPCKPAIFAELYDDVIHTSDCAVHNMPAFPNGPCDCQPKEPHK